MLLHPIWLVLLVPLVLALWLWRLPSRLLLSLRTLGLLLLVLALCGAAVRLPSRAGTVVVVADRSHSMPHGSATAQKEVIDLLQTGMGPDDRLAVVSFGQVADVERPPETGKFGGFTHEVGGDGSDLAGALEQALALIPRDAPGRLLLLSDGRWTGREPIRMASSAAARGTAIDYRPMQRPAAGDLAIVRVDAPPSVSPGESYLLTAWVRSPVSQSATVSLRRDGRVLTSGEQQLVAGLNRLTFRDRAPDPGTLAYTLDVRGSGSDPVPENNHARLLVGVRGPRPILHVSRAPNSGLARLLRAGKLNVKTASPEECAWDLEGLSKYSAVLLEDVPAQKLGTVGMETLARWVKETGSGLFMTGGRNSYGPGGYFRSPIEPILPVSLELRDEHRKLSVAMAIALDRSGSMAVPVGGGRTKMDLANEGTAAVIDLLGPQDELGVLAVDTAAHVIADLAPLKNKEAVRAEVLGIRSQGGGIFIHEALAAASKMLLDARAGTRHILLFADANDSEEPGDYPALLGKCREAGITVSVIGLGTEKDKDAELLRDIARRGDGRVFFTDKPEELPRLFAQDTFNVARNAFLDEPTKIESTPGLAELTGRPWKLSESIGGYNLCYLRPEATLGTVTRDDYKAPVVAAWHCGSGRVVCYTGEADGKYAGDIVHWSGVGDYFTSLARWAAGPTDGLPGNLLVTQEVKNGLQVVRLHLDPEREQDPFVGTPAATFLRARPGTAPQSQKESLHWTGPDTLSVELPLHGTATSLATVEIPGRSPFALPPVCLPYSPEFAPSDDERGLQTLERLARATAGKERVDLAGIWKELPRHPRRISVVPWLLSAAIVLLLLEVLERRTGLLSRQARLAWNTAGRVRHALQRQPRPSPVRVVRPAPAPPPVELPPPEPAPPPAPTRKPAAGADMLDALRQARQRTRGRIDS